MFEKVCNASHPTAVFVLIMGAEKKIPAGILAILLGGLGIHKFYLGYTTAGIIQLLLGLCGVGSIIGLVEGIIYLTKTDEDFAATYVYNKKEWF
ncbi:XynA Predicted membrane protein [Fimbriimonadaceae bacterium]